MFQISYINKTNEGLGISLEGTVDVDDVTGLEDKPHHYIRTIAIDGPIGLDGTFRPGDELLEVLNIHYRLISPFLYI